MRNRVSSIGPVATFAGALGLGLGVCCGLPLVLSLGVAGAIAGWSLQRSVVIVLGIAMAAAGVLQIIRRRQHGQLCQPARAAASTEAATGRTAHSTEELTSSSTQRENRP
jgi:uncharacterized membrane protein